MNKVIDISETLSPELRLICACVKHQIIKTEEQKGITGSFAGQIDWDMFVHLSLHHRVYPLVYQCLSSLERSDVPHEVVDVLRQKSRENMTKTLQMTGELVKVLRALGKNGISAVVLKGFPLAYKCYGNVALRPSRDLDILVWAEDVVKARAVLELYGYEDVHPKSVALTPARVRNWRASHFEYWHKEKEICIELHWRLCHCDMEIPLNRIENSLERIKIAEQPVCVMGTEELLLYLIPHGAKHGWFRLRWLCDIGMMLRQGDFSWERLYVLAKELGFETSLNQAVILSRDLLAAPVPDNIAEIVAKDRKAQKLADMTLVFINEAKCDLTNLEEGMPLYDHKRMYLSVFQWGWRRRWTNICSRLWPTESDIALISLPDYLYFMYYLIRLCTGFSRRLSELLGKH